MDFQEMMKESRGRLLSEVMHLKTVCERRFKKIKEELKELEADSQSLKVQKEAAAIK